MNIAESFGIMLVGMLVVFLGLIILIFCIQIMSFAFLKKDKHVDTNIKATETELEIVKPEEPTDFQEEVSPSIVAAITAAISFLLQPGSKFIVKRVKRTNNTIQ